MNSKESNNSESLERTTERLRCRAIKRDGSQCTAFAIKDGLCVGHIRESIEGRAKGGVHSSKKHRLDAKLPLRLRPVLSLLEAALVQVYKGDLRPSQAQAIAALASATVRVIEAGVLEERLIELEEKFGGGRLLRVREEREVTQIIGGGNEE